MQHLIKRSTGLRAASSPARKDGLTLAERMAANRKASRSETDDHEVEEAASLEPVQPTAQPAPAPQMRIEEPASVAKAEPAPATQPAATNTDAIVEAAKAARDGKAVPVSNGKTCLIVDDSRVIRKVARGIVSGMGYTVIEAENGEEALIRCRASMPDLVMTDWNMPVMGGLEFVKNLRAMPESKSAKVVFCTSKGEASDIHEGIAAGADDYIVKPFEEAAVEAKLAKLAIS